MRKERVHTKGSFWRTHPWPTVMALGVLLVFGESGCKDSDSPSTPQENEASDGSSSDTESTLPLAGSCVPGGTPQSLPKTAREYVEMCEPELGVPPQMNCSAGTTIPIYLDGVQVWDLLPNFGCENPGLQAGGCVPGSTLHRVTGQTREGVALPQVNWIHFCRSEDMWKGDPTGWDTIFTGAQMIGYNSATGATCFFELNYGVQEQWVTRDENNRASGVLPNYDEPEFDEAFIPGQECNTCHQNDAFIHNPWVSAAKMPDNPTESVLPVLPKNSPYYIVGGSNYDMRTIHIEGNACLTCHRIGMGTDELFRSLGVDANQWMPPHAPGSLSEDYAELLECWANGPENTPDCEWVIPPAGDCDGGVVGPDYPYAPNVAGGENVFEEDEKEEGGEDEDDFDLPPCPEDFAATPGAPCQGDWTETLCLYKSQAWWCENEKWMTEDDKDEFDKDEDDEFE